jgi:hypothetical protein
MFADEREIILQGLRIERQFGFQLAPFGSVQILLRGFEQDAGCARNLEFAQQRIAELFVERDAFIVLLRYFFLKCQREFAGHQWQ